MTMLLGVAAGAGAQSEDGGGGSGEAEPCFEGGGAEVVAGRYTGAIDVTVKSSGSVAGNEMTIASVLRTLEEKPFELEVGYQGETDTPDYSGQAEVEVSMGIDVSGQPITATGGSTNKATLNVGETEVWYLIDLKGKLPATMFSVDVTGRGASASDSTTQQPADAHLVLEINDYTCDTISGSLSAESPTIKNLGQAYTAMGLETSAVGTWSVTLQDKDEELEARVMEAVDKAKTAPPSFGLADELLALAAELQELPVGSFGKCFADDVLEAASLVVVKLQRVLVEGWGNEFGWTPRSEVEVANEDGTFSIGDDAGRFSSPAPKLFMQDVRRALRAAVALSQVIGSDCTDHEINALIADISFYLFEEAQRAEENGTGTPKETLAEAGMVMMEGAVSDEAKSDVNAYASEYEERARKAAGADD